MIDPFGPVRSALAGYTVSAPAGPWRLDTGASIVLDSSGAGEVILAPTGRQSWTVTTLAVSVSSDTRQPSARVYLDTVSPATFLGGTYSGANDSSEMQVTVPPGGRLIVRWEGGDPGARATVSVYGTYELR